MSYKFTSNIIGYPWTVYIGGFYPLRVALATTINESTYIKDKICPSFKTLKHEFYHRVNTSWIKYFLSWSIGRIWGDRYWKLQELRANDYALSNHQEDTALNVLTMHIRLKLPVNYITTTIDHPV